MAEPAVPLLLTLLTGGVSGGGMWTSDADHVAGAPVLALRGGLTFPAERLDVELVIGRSEGLLREVPYPYEVGYTHFDALFWLGDGLRFDPYVSAGGGWRALQIRQTTIDGKTPEESVRFDVDPVMEALLSAGVGLRVTLWGPLHLRADARLSGVFGNQPVDEPAHFFPGFDGTIGVDFRHEGPLDRDRDHVPDKRDQCRDEPEDPDFFDDGDGCPEDDDDKDGIGDLADRCKDLAEDVDGFLDDDGCPETNNDNDGFPDSLDRCPSEAETQNAWLDGDGCPDGVPPALAAVLGIRPAIAFDGPTLLPSADADLLLVMAALAAHPEAIIQFRVHNDGLDGATGSHARSKAQAIALHAWLVAHGADLRGYDFKALGDQAPLARDDTAEGLAKNRRVEVRLYSALGADGRPIDYTPVPPENW